MVCLDKYFKILNCTLQVSMLSTGLELESDNCKWHSLLSDSARGPAAPTHPCTAFFQTALRTQCRHNLCKGTYACVRPHRYTYGNYWDTVGNVDASDTWFRCIGKIIVRDLWLVASRLYRMAVTWPGLCATVTVSPSLGADLLGCISRPREMEIKGKH